VDLKDRAFYPESDFRAVYDQIEAPSAQALQSLTHHPVSFLSDFLSKQCTGARGNDINVYGLGLRRRGRRCGGGRAGPASAPDACRWPPVVKSPPHRALPCIFP
jgi:hypothetical protein